MHVSLLSWLASYIPAETRICAGQVLTWSVMHSDCVSSLLCMYPIPPKHLPRTIRQNRALSVTCPSALPWELFQIWLLLFRSFTTLYFLQCPVHSNFGRWYHNPKRCCCRNRKFVTFVVLPQAVVQVLAVTTMSHVQTTASSKHS